MTSSNARRVLHSLATPHHKTSYSPQCHIVRILNKCQKKCQIWINRKSGKMWTSFQVNKSSVGRRGSSGPHAKSHDGLLGSYTSASAQPLPGGRVGKPHGKTRRPLDALVRLKCSLGRKAGAMGGVLTSQFTSFLKNSGIPLRHTVTRTLYAKLLCRKIYKTRLVVRYYQERTYVCFFTPGRCSFKAANDAQG